VQKDMMELNAEVERKILFERNKGKERERERRKGGKGDQNQHTHLQSFQMSQSNEHLIVYLL